jgi:hypothetical protein
VFGIALFLRIGFSRYVAIATIILKPVLALAGEILSFASPKESIQRKGDPDAACFLRFSHLPGVVKRDFPVPLTTCGIPAAPLRTIPDKCSDARRGIRERG